MDPMSTEANRGAAVAIFEQGWNRGAFGALDGLLASPFSLHIHGVSRTMDRSGFERTVTAWRTAVPDLRFEIHDVVAEGDLVSIRATLTGTHLGPLRDRPPTGNALAVDHMFLLRLRDGVLADV
jgi:predicted ester cyclase